MSVGKVKGCRRRREIRFATNQGARLSFAELAKSLVLSPPTIVLKPPRHSHHRSTSRSANLG